MKHLKFLLIFFVSWSLSVSADSVSDECKKEWPGDYQMQEFCMKQATDGAESIQDFLARYDMTTDNWVEHSVRGEVPALILKKCSEKWHPDMNMIAFCIEEEEKSAIRLGKIGGSPENSVEFKPGVSGDIAAIGVSTDYLERHNYEHVSVAKEAAARGEQAGIIWVECESKDHRAEAKCLLRRENSELK